MCISTCISKKISCTSRRRTKVSDNLLKYLRNVGFVNSTFFWKISTFNCKNQSVTFQQKPSLRGADLGCILKAYYSSYVLSRNANEGMCLLRTTFIMYDAYRTISLPLISLQDRHHTLYTIAHVSWIKFRRAYNNLHHRKHAYKKWKRKILSVDRVFVTPVACVWRCARRGQSLCHVLRV